MYKYIYNLEMYFWDELPAVCPNISFCPEEQANIEVLKSYGIERVEYTPPPPPLDDVKTAKINELKTQRNAEEKAPVKTDLGAFDFDDDARARIQGAMEILYGTEETVEWTLADNTSTPVSYNDLHDVILNAAVRCNMLHQKYRELRDLVNACETAEEVAKIDWGIIN